MGPSQKETIVFKSSIFGVRLLFASGRVMITGYQSTLLKLIVRPWNKETMTRNPRIELKKQPSWWFFPTHLKNMYYIVKLGIISPGFGPKISKMFEVSPPSYLGVEPKIVGKPPKWMVKIMENPMNKWKTQATVIIDPKNPQKHHRLEDQSTDFFRFKAWQYNT